MTQKKPHLCGFRGFYIDDNCRKPVCFERKNDNRSDYAEIMLPCRKIISSRGFDEGEMAQLQLYLKEKEKSIIKNAKQINHDLIFKL